MNKFDIKDGEYTSTIYTLIKEQRFHEAIAILTFIYDSNPSSRAALSLLAYCHYYMQVYLHHIYTISHYIYTISHYIYSISTLYPQYIHTISTDTPTMQDYVSAANCYEQLSLLHPDEVRCYSVRHL